MWDLIAQFVHHGTGYPESPISSAPTISHCWPGRGRRTDIQVSAPPAGRGHDRLPRRAVPPARHPAGIVAGHRAWTDPGRTPPGRRISRARCPRGCVRGMVGFGSAGCPRSVAGVAVAEGADARCHRRPRTRWDGVIPACTPRVHWGSHCPEPGTRTRGPSAGRSVRVAAFDGTAG